MAIDAENTENNEVADADVGAGDDVEIVTPVIVDLGEVKRKHIKRLKRGEGRLTGEVLDIVDEVADVLADDLAGSTLVPIVLIYERKPKKNRRRTIELPFL